MLRLKELMYLLSEEGINYLGDSAQQLIMLIKENEIWTSLINIGNTKALGIGGFNSFFFKSNWKIVKKDIFGVIMNFFTTCTLYVVNCSLITLIPKSSDAKTIKDMRHISCGITIYKIISNIITTRLVEVINEVVDDSQSGFVLGKIIHDNIMLAQELVRGYGRKNISLRCMIQMEI